MQSLCSHAASPATPKLDEFRTSSCLHPSFRSGQLWPCRRNSELLRSSKATCTGSRHARTSSILTSTALIRLESTLPGTNIHSIPSSCLTSEKPRASTSRGPQQRNQAGIALSAVGKTSGSPLPCHSRTPTQSKQEPHDHPWQVTLTKAASRLLAASLAASLALALQPIPLAWALVDPTGSMELEVERLGGYTRGGWRPDISEEDAREISGVKEEDGDVTNEPQQVHISLWGPGRMMVTWLTSDMSAPSIVEYGRASGEYQHSVKGTSDSYAYASYRSDLIHQVVLGSEDDPLVPDTQYFYRCSGHEREFSFKTPPASLPLNVAVVGDLGQTGWTVSTLEHIEQQPYDLLILPGDLSYADRFQPRWDTWGMLVEPEASTRPWMTVVGNHEAEWLPFLEPDPWKPYDARWPNPHAQAPTPSDSNLFYSFETAGVHWLMLCAYDDFTPESEQYEWLQRDLAAVDRTKTPWLIAVLHTPWYNSNYAHRTGGELMRQNLESVLYAAQTDLVFAGHVHAYERTARVYDNDLDPCGIVHIVIGDGGNREGLASRYYPQPEWSVRREASFGHGEIQFNEDGSADWSWHRNDDDQSVMADSVKLYPHKMTARQVKEAKASGVDIPDDRCPVL